MQKFSELVRYHSKLFAVGRTRLASCALTSACTRYEQQPNTVSAWTLPTVFILHSRNTASSNDSWACSIVLWAVSPSDVLHTPICGHLVSLHCHLYLPFISTDACPLSINTPHIVYTDCYYPNQAEVMASPLVNLHKVYHLRQCVPLYVRNSRHFAVITFEC